MAGLWLDDAEYAELLRELTRVLQPRLATRHGRAGSAGSSGTSCCPGATPPPARGTGPHPTLTTRPAREAMRRMLTH